TSTSSTSSTTTLFPDDDEYLQELADERQKARDSKNWAKSDELRKKIEELGFEIEDGKDGFKIKKV
ncbi:MAG: hypothetical protein V1688_01875, partial [bacterium]